MGGVEADNVYLLQGEGIRGRMEAPGTMVAANGGLEASECDVRRIFGGSKGA